MPFQKIDSEGCYTPFPGLTIVSSIHAKDHAFWENIYNALLNCTNLKKFYTPLPWESFHMTAVNLFTEEAIGSKDWEGFIKRNQHFFSQINKSLSNQSVTFNPIITNLITASVIQLELALPKEQDKTISVLANTFHLSTNKPSRFHMTLAYQYRPIRDEELAKITEELQKKLVSIIHHYPEPLSLNPAKLCYFNDMTAFIPWDGSASPFKKNTAYPTFFHDSARLKKEDENASSSAAASSDFNQCNS